jgi:RNA polymerase sigma-70 factor (ECF subfamily)
MGIEAGRVFCEHLNLAYRVALAATGDPAEAEDAVQDSYLRFAESWASFDRSRPVEPFLALIVARTASNRGRAESRRAAREETRAREDAMNAVETPSVSAEELAALRSAVAALPAGERLAVSLHYLEGLTIDDTAAALAVPRTTAANHVKKGLDELKKVLTAAGFGAAAAPAILAAMPRPEAPASLAAAVEKIVSGQVPMVGSGAGSAGAAVGAATKGGMAMKIIVSVVAAGVLAGAAGLSAFGLRPSACGLRSRGIRGAGRLLLLPTASPRRSTSTRGSRSARRSSSSPRSRRWRKRVRSGRSRLRPRASATPR